MAIIATVSVKLKQIKDAYIKVKVGEVQKSYENITPVEKQVLGYIPELKEKYVVSYTALISEEKNSEVIERIEFSCEYDLQGANIIEQCYVDLKNNFTKYKDE